jgi:hypothetical protein
LPSVARRSALHHSTGRTLAALLGSLPVALLLGLALAAKLPVSQQLAYLIGSYSVIPLWALCACATFLAPSARSAWLRLLAVGLSALLLCWSGLS